MSGPSVLDSERHAAAFELIGAVNALIEQKIVPEYMNDFLRSRAERLRRTYEIQRQRVERADA